ncbi:hypothetical protein PTI98_000694 [Pleurotus ostreatus]|nr:hypothetical protein PTI98_000694 [Pleurotus ostreatus]
MRIDALSLSPLRPPPPPFAVLDCWANSQVAKQQETSIDTQISTTVPQLSELQHCSTPRIPPPRPFVFSNPMCKTNQLVLKLVPTTGNPGLCLRHTVALRLEVGRGRLLIHLLNVR